MNNLNSVLHWYSCTYMCDLDTIIFKYSNYKIIE